MNGEATNKDSLLESWIEKFVFELGKYLKQSNTESLVDKYQKRLDQIAQIKVVSLNYDRVFEARSRLAASRLFDVDFLTWQQKNILKWPAPTLSFEIHQPHGTLGLLSGHSQKGSASNVPMYLFEKVGFRIRLFAQSPISNPRNQLEFGDIKAFTEACENRPTDFEPELNIVSVDDFIPGASLSGYELANQRINNTNVICIGISDLGFNQSRLDFSNAKSVTLTNRESELRQFDKSKLPTDQNIFFEPGGLFADNLLAKMCV
ncbi:hypothetical protein SAMN05444003_2958 [Cognatiyoonia sediminum]|uniref:Uncharacterized protein n=1 Tax=Cognatiyoonia sediminum TaxID=1508389 RepID=A0A1M5SGT4_9RHOB|nr:hypothetical protein [Cognatiyoonia sediminum]SHH37630.1 hypothetical protein SAMN05444003_2958 [Cognatiyoonia sediminum]